MCVCGHVPLVLPALAIQPDDRVERPGDPTATHLPPAGTFASPPLRAVRTLLELYVDGQLAGFDRLLAGVAPMRQATPIDVLTVERSDANGPHS